MIKQGRQNALKARPHKASLKASIPSDTEVFERWQRREKAAGTLKQASSIRVYAGMWRAYCEWLIERGLDWSAVQPADLTDFLQGPAPGRNNRRKPLQSQRMSSYTRQRYRRLLDGIYQLALVERWRDDHRSRLSQILPPGVLMVSRTLQQLYSPKSREASWFSPGLRSRRPQAY